jgi:DNA-binding MarR family transcriptional regulator
MNDELKERFLHSLFLFKKASYSISRSLSNNGNDGLSAAELSALGCINCRGSEDCGPAEQTTHHAMHETLSVSKAAVSQMLGSLEKRGYIRREIDRDNRRKIIITLTKKGNSAIDKGQKHMDGLMASIIERFGEEDIRDFVRLLDRFAEVVDETVNKSGGIV